MYLKPSEQKITILVGYHKPATLFKSEILTPIFLGSASINDKSITIQERKWLNETIKDNTGENISSKNHLYAETTGLYWAWKNYDQIGDPDYIGLVHYRRLLNFYEKKDEEFLGLSTDIIKKQVCKYDIILSEPLKAWSNKEHKFMDNVYSQYSIEHYEKHISALANIIKTNYPSMLDALEKVLYNSSKISWYGIFVMKKKLFFEYSNFLFDILEKVEVIQKTDNYPSEQQRVCGFLSEIILNIFCEYKLSVEKKLKVHYLPLYRIESDKSNQYTKFGCDINICYSTDDSYIKYTATSLASVLSKANALDKYHIFIFSDKISTINKIRLNSLKKIKKFDIRYVNIKPHDVEIFKNIRIPNHINICAYYRLLIPKYLPNLEKVIYLDSDTIVLKDLNTFFNLDTGDAWFCGCEDINALKLARQLNYSDSKYINSGCLLINNSLCIENNYFEIMKDTIQKNYRNYFICDQDVLNDAFHFNIKYISYRFNMFYSFHKLLETFKPSFPDDFKDSVSNPTIIHFVGKNKPWDSESDNPYKDIYKQYQNMTFCKVHSNISLGSNFFQYINNEQEKKIKLFFITVKHIKRSPEKITKRFLGIKYYKKFICQDGETEYKFFGLKKIN